MRRTVLKILLLAFIVVVPIEVLSFAACMMLQRAGLMWTPPDLDGYEAFFEARDPLLGWPSPTTPLEAPFAADRTRADPGFPNVEEAPPCAATFGDSFTWGDEVGPAESYAAVLGRELGCRVANFGTPGHGTDQALLRFRDRAGSTAPVVVLGHYSGDIIRNVNRYRGFLATSGGGYGAKPRFLVGRDGLELIPLPELSKQDLAELGDRPDLVPHEFFFPGGESGIPQMRFPYTLSALSVLGHYRIQARLRGVPSYADFYSETHSSGALGVTLGVVREFARVALERGQHPILILIPDEKDLIEAKAGRALPYQPLTDAARASGIEVVDGAEAALEVLGEREPCAIYTRCGGAHFNPEGYAMIAHALRPRVEEALSRVDRLEVPATESVFMDTD